MQLGTFSLKSFQFYVHVRYIKWNRFVFVATFRLEIIEKKSSIFALSVQKGYVKGTVDPKEANLTLMVFFLNIKFKNILKKKTSMLLIRGSIPFKIGGKKNILQWNM